MIHIPLTIEALKTYAGGRIGRRVADIKMIIDLYESLGRQPYSFFEIPYSTWELIVKNIKDRTAEQIEHSWAHYLFSYGMILMEDGKYENANKYFQDAINAYNDSLYYDHLIKLYKTNNQLDEERDILIKAINTFPDVDKYKRWLKTNIKKRESLNK